MGVNHRHITCSAEYSRNHILFDIHTGIKTHTHELNKLCPRSSLSLYLARSLSLFLSLICTPMKIIDVLSYKTVAAP